MEEVFRKNKENFFIGFLFIFAFLLRIGYLFFLKKFYFFYDHPAADVIYYQEWAREIASGNILGTNAFHGLPLYPYFLAVLWRLTLGNILALRLFHILLGSMNCLLIYFLGKKIFSQKTAKLAALLATSNFMLIYYDWLMMPVTLLISLSLVIVLGFLNLNEKGGTRDWLILGILGGLTILGDGKFLFFFVFTSIFFLLRSRGTLIGTLFKKLLPLGLGILLVLSIITVRNRVVFGDWIFISPQSGLSLYVGNNPTSTGIFENPEFIRPTHKGQDEDQQIIAQAIAKKNLSPAEISQFWRKKSLFFIRTEPEAFLKLLSNKVIMFFTETEKAYDIDLILLKEWKNVLDFNSLWLLWPLAILGCFLGWRHRKQTEFINLLILSQFTMTLVFFLTNRHRATILPFLILFESYFICWLVEKARLKKYHHLILAVLFIGIFMFSFRPQRLDAKTIQFLRHAKSGPVFERRGQNKKAQEQYYQALALRPYDTNTLYNLANTYLADKDYEMAQNFYKKALSTCSYNIDALYNLAYTYEVTGQSDRALSTYHQVLEYQPENLDTHFRMAGIYIDRKECDNAKKHLELIINKQPPLREKLSNLLSQCEKEI